MEMSVDMEINATFFMNVQWNLWLTCQGKRERALLKILKLHGLIW
jgi:hypothetical protein